LGSNNFYVRSSLPAEQILRAIPAVMKTIDPNLPLEELKTLPQRVEGVFLDRMISTLSASFAMLATILAAVGLYEGSRTRWRSARVRSAYGWRSARTAARCGNGAQRVGMMTLVGGVIGIAGAIALGRAAQSLLFELQGHDPVVIIFSVVALALVAFGAGFIPAMRASRIDPMQALRYE
jgi:predicted lysophospholipase L1 biosynthesis ABC-type transport system permease subunit